jgi:dihydroorotate dehydrogenase electron transfer subunit
LHLWSKTGIMEVMLKTYIPHAAAITKIEPLNENTKMYTLDLSLGCLPGQFVNLWIPEVDEKPFSVAYDDGHQIKIAIAKVGPFYRNILSK